MEIPWTKLHLYIGRKIAYRPGFQKAIAYFIPERVEGHTMYGTDFYKSGIVIPNQTWTISPLWELVESPTTSFILED